MLLVSIATIPLYHILLLYLSTIMEDELRGLEKAKRGRVIIIHHGFLIAIDFFQKLCEELWQGVTTRGKSQEYHFP